MNDDFEHTVIDVYRRHGPSWATLRGDQLPEKSWIDLFRTLLPPGGDVLDVGCGSGVPIARELVRHGFNVTGVDAAPEMLALFRLNIPDQSAIAADMRTLSLGRTFAGVLAWDRFFSPVAIRAARHVRALRGPRLSGRRIDVHQRNH